MKLPYFQLDDTKFYNAVMTGININTHKYILNNEKSTAYTFILHSLNGD